MKTRRLIGAAVGTIIVLAAVGLAMAVPSHGAAPRPLVVPAPLDVRMTGITPSGANYKFVVGWTNPVDAGITHISWFLSYSTGAGAACNGGGPSGGGTASGNFAGDTASGAAYVDTLGTAFGSAFITSGHSFAFALRLTDGSGNSAVVCAFLPHYESAFVPNAPTFIAATPSATGAVTVNWTDNATQFGSVGLVGANVTVWPNATCSGVPTENVTASGTSKTVTGLTVGTTYSFVATVSNATGFGFNSTCANATAISFVAPVLVSSTSALNEIVWVLTGGMLLALVATAWARRRD